VAAVAVQVTKVLAALEEQAAVEVMAQMLEPLILVVVAVVAMEVGEQVALAGLELLLFPMPMLLKMLQPRARTPKQLLVEIPFIHSQGRER
jgi:hypothetical protein